MRTLWPIYPIMLTMTLLLALCTSWLTALITMVWIVALMVSLTSLAAKLRTDH